MAKHHIEPVVFFPIGSKTTASAPTSKDQTKYFRGIGIHHENDIDHSLPVHIWNSTPRAYNVDGQMMEFGFLALERQKLCRRTEGSVLLLTVVTVRRPEHERSVGIQLIRISLSERFSMIAFAPNGHPVWSNKRT